MGSEEQGEGRGGGIKRLRPFSVGWGTFSGVVPHIAVGEIGGRGSPRTLSSMGRTRREEGRGCTTLEGRGCTTLLILFPLTVPALLSFVSWGSFEASHHVSWLAKLGVSRDAGAPKTRSSILAEGDAAHLLTFPVGRLPTSS